MRIAHLSDLHLLDLEGAVPQRLFNKRLTGYLNLRFHRKSVHKPHAVKAAARALEKLGIDHLVITGDMSNLALEREFAMVQRFLDEDLGMSPDKVSLIPGNHDTYTAGAHRSRRFDRSFAPFLQSDLPELTMPGEAYPYVKLRGPVAVIGLSTALPRLPLVASGAVGRDQLACLARILAHTEVKMRTPVILQHHPIHNPPSFAKRTMEGLSDAAREIEVLSQVSRGLLLHGHLHRRVHRLLRTKGGHIDAVGATSASLLHASDERMAGFNLYEIDDGDGSIREMSTHALDQSTEDFREVALPRPDASH